MPERGGIPEWARRERQSDFAWIGENLDSFWPRAKEMYQETGRGAFFVNTTSRPTGEGNPYLYFPQKSIEQELGIDEDTKRIVGEYNPDKEFVVVLWKTRDRTSTYRIKPIQPRPKRGRLR